MKSRNPHAIYRFMSNCCRDCQFLAKELYYVVLGEGIRPVEEPATPWNFEERRRLGVNSLDTALCWKGVWSEKIERRCLDLKENRLERPRATDVSIVEALQAGNDF